MTTQALPHGLDPDHVRAVMGESRAEREALDRAWEHLIAQHDGEWVAAHRGEYVFGDSPQAAADRASHRGWPLDVTVIEHLARARPLTLL
jgi:hypothetical protein